MNIDHLADLIATCKAGLKEIGITVELCYDFARAERELLACGKPSFTPMMSVDHNSFTNEAFLWVLLKCDGVTIGGACAKYDNIRDEAIDAFWMRTLRRHYIEEFDTGAKVICDAETLNISGKVVYLGELFVAKNKRGSAKQLRLFVHLLFAYAGLKWADLDHIYVTMRADDIQNGKIHLYGFTEQTPWVIQWSGGSSGRFSSESIVSIPRAKLKHISRIYAEDPKRLTIGMA